MWLSGCGVSTAVIHISERQPTDVYIGREGKGESGYFGNPFKIGPGESRGDTIERYKAYFLNRLKEDATFKARIVALKGERLVCFCKPHPCHGDVIAEWLNARSFCKTCQTEMAWDDVTCPKCAIGEEE
jgi:hypothetical protein